MAVSSMIYTAIKRATGFNVPFLSFVHMLKTNNIAYNYGEVGDAYAAQIDIRDKSKALQGLSPDAIPSMGEISTRMMRQPTKFHVFGFVEVYDRDTGLMHSIPQHVYTDNLTEIGNYNQMLIDSFHTTSEWTGRYEVPRVGLVTSAHTEMIEYNEGW